MLFNSLQFAVFFIIVYSVYLIMNHKWQNRMLLVASCIFYGAWNWRFLFLMFTSISFDYFCALKIHGSNDEKVRKRFLLLSIIINLSILGFFKYFNFFASNLQAMFYNLGLPISMRIINVILPVGISFYTFEAMSYVLDVYKRKMEPTRDYLDYALFVTYFPHLVAGPIMRAKDLLPQISFPRQIKRCEFYKGCHLIFWGLFQKIFIADSLAKMVDPVFASRPPYDGLLVLLSIYAFAFQIYCDFAGYSNIARGLGKVMGFDIMVNFNLPYFSTNPQEFWKRWHISLSTWLRDYLYIPLGGNRYGTFNTYRNLAITMFLGGLWHGAAWTFVIWGVYWGVLLIVDRLLRPFLERMPLPKNILVKKIWFYVRAVFFFHLICLGWLIFRAHSAGQVFDMLRNLFFDFNFQPNFTYIRASGFFSLIFFTSILVVVQFFQYIRNDQEIILKTNSSIRAIFYATCLWLLITFGMNTTKEFIYFQF